MYIRFIHIVKLRAENYSNSAPKTGGEITGVFNQSVITTYMSIALFPVYSICISALMNEFV